MKYLLIAAAAVLVLTGCHSNDYQGSPGQESYMENGTNQVRESRAGENFPDVGRQSSPTSRFGPANGTGNF